MMWYDGVHPLVNSGIKPYKHISFEMQPNGSEFCDFKIGSSQAEVTLEKKALLF